MKHVYFIKPVGHAGPYKIGCSKEPEARLRSVEIWSPLLLEIVAFVEGSNREENILHQMLGETRLHGEWFAQSAKLDGIIRYVKRTGSLPPLDYSLSPYKTGKSSMVRRGSPRLRQDKHNITRRIRNAERRVYGYAGSEYMRPDDIEEIYQSYQGISAPMPTDEQLAKLQEYIDLLAECPSAPTNFASWKDWQKIVARSAA